MSDLTLEPDVQTLELIYTRVLPHFAHILMPSGEKITSDNTKVSSLGQGLINRTYLISTAQRQLVLQCLNTHVFPSPWDLVNNSEVISAFLETQAQQGRYSLAVIKPLRLMTGELALDLAAQGFWRGLSFIDDSMTLLQVDNVTQAAQVGATFGHFSANLSAIKPSAIIDVIKDFHNLPKRLGQLAQAVEADSVKRLSQCQSWVDLALSQSILLDELAQVEAKLPRRICHNDTKINNMLFSVREGKPLAVIDLDTCMASYLMYDFGDMVRAFCSPVAEDAIEFEQVRARPELIIAAAKGYIAALEGILTQDEQASLWLGVKAITLMLAVRFLTDYLQGDSYFTVTRAEHNLQRARNQFSLYLSLQAQDDAMTAEFSKATPLKV